MGARGLVGVTLLSLLLHSVAAASSGKRQVLHLHLHLHLMAPLHLGGRFLTGGASEATRS